MVWTFAATVWTFTPTVWTFRVKVHTIFPKVLTIFFKVLFFKTKNSKNNVLIRVIEPPPRLQPSRQLVLGF